MLDIIAIDTTPLINLMNVNWLYLLKHHPASFVCSGVVGDEIIKPEQKRQYTCALLTGYLKEYETTDLMTATFTQTLSRYKSLGEGEKSIITLAHYLKCQMATDDKYAIKVIHRIANFSAFRLPVVRFQDIIVELIKNGAITVNEADHMLDEWASKHRFRLAISSFRELL